MGVATWIVGALRWCARFLLSRVMARYAPLYLPDMDTSPLEEEGMIRCDPVSISTDAALVALHALRSQRRMQPRVFLVTWDNSKVRTRDMGKHVKQEAWGTHYPNGLVTLDNGSQFAVMGELHYTLGAQGVYAISYVDEEAQA